MDDSGGQVGGEVMARIARGTIFLDVEKPGRGSLAKPSPSFPGMPSRGREDQARKKDGTKGTSVSHPSVMMRPRVTSSSVTVSPRFG